MKLSNAQIAAVAQATGANPIPEEDPAEAKLREIVGEHTFYLDQQGLVVLETPDHPEATAEMLEVVRVGQWTDEQRQQMGMIPPQRTGQVVDLAAARQAGNGEDTGTA